MPSISFLPRILWNLLSSGLPVDTDLEILRKVVVINFTVLFGGTMMLFFGTLNLLRESESLAIADFITVTVMALHLIALRMSFELSSVARSAVRILGFFLLLIVAVGESYQITFSWAFTFPVIAIFLLGHRRGLPLVVGFLAALILYFAVDSHIPWVTHYHLSLEVRVVSAYALTTIFVVIMEENRRLLFNKLEEKREELRGQIDVLAQGTREKEALIERLSKNLSEVKTLQGFLPICAQCKKIRDDDGYWNQIEEYLNSHTDASIELGICPECQSGRQS